MSERKSDEALRQWKYQTPEDVWNEMRRARAEEARLLEVVKKQEERIAVLETAMRAVMGSLTRFGEDGAVVHMRREAYAKVLAAEVSP